MATQQPLLIKKAYADTSEGQLHYRYSISPSTENTPIVFLHKSASSSQSYVSLMSRFGRTHTCYAPDMPGFGQSFDPAQVPNTGYYVSHFVRLFESAGLTEYHIVGHHTGACLAVEMAAKYPERVKSITLIGASIMTEDERAAMKKMFFQPFNEPVRDGSHLLKTWEYLGKMGVGEDLELWQREAVDHIRAWRGRTQCYGAVWAQDCLTLYHKVMCPILVLCADDDVLWPFFAQIKTIRPEVRTEVIGGANFSLDRDVDRCAQLIAGFIGGGLEMIKQ